MPLLDVIDLEATYGGVKALYGMSFHVEEGETAVFLGLNGAGKTTTMMCLAGLMKPSAGSITYQDKPVGGVDAKKMVQKGVVLVPEGRRIFPGLSVDRNLLIGSWVKRGDSKFIAERKAEVFEYFPRLKERHTQLAGTLSGGEQQMLAVGRGLMADPKLLLIDEASLGLAPVIVRDLLGIIKQINGTGVTVILVEQNASALNIADRAFIIEKGTLIHSAEGDEIRERTDLREAYLG